MTGPLGSDRSWKDRGSPDLKAVGVELGPQIRKLRTSRNQSPCLRHLGSYSTQLIFNIWLVIWLTKHSTVSFRCDFALGVSLLSGPTFRSHENPSQVPAPRTFAMDNLGLEQTYQVKSTDIRLNVTIVLLL